MAYVITSKCVATCDTACVDVCPVDCIDGPVSVAELRSVSLEQRGARFPGLQMFIDPDPCICCGACVAECPVDAIVQENEASVEDRARNGAFFRPHPKAAR
jgi:NAD-dependent dihydropyrimidine dehydrogenase PreA subunit